jgi:hypothetical protein
MTAYIISSLTAAIVIVGWQGSAINALGNGYGPRVIASTAIGGANLIGGEGGTYGAFVGAALPEVIRDSLLMQGIDSNRQGAFVGAFHRPHGSPGKRSAGGGARNLARLFVQHYARIAFARLFVQQ